MGPTLLGKVPALYTACRAAAEIISCLSADSRLPASARPFGKNILFIYFAKLRQ
jgi:hypothetical protein